MFISRNIFRVSHNLLCFTPFQILILLCSFTQLIKFVYFAFYRFFSRYIFSICFVFSFSFCYFSLPDLSLLLIFLSRSTCSAVLRYFKRFSWTVIVLFHSLCLFARLAFSLHGNARTSERMRMNLSQRKKIIDIFIVSKHISPEAIEF